MKLLKKICLLIFSLGGIIFLSNCTIKGDLEKLQLKHYKLKQRVKRLREDQSIIKAQLTRLEAQIRKLNNVFEQFRKKGQYNFANIGVKLDELRTHHQELLGKFQVLKLSFDKLQEQHQKLFKAYSERFGDPTKTEQNAQVTIQVVDAEALYKSARALFKSGKYREAREQLKLMVQRYPDHKLTDDAYILIGECYEKDKNYYEAIAWYNDVLRKFPNGDQIELALLRLGAAHYRIKACPEGRQFLRRLIRKYPKSPHVSLARQLLRNWRHYCR